MSDDEIRARLANSSHAINLIKMLHDDVIIGDFVKNLVALIQEFSSESIITLPDNPTVGQSVTIEAKPGTKITIVQGKRNELDPELLAVLFHDTYERLAPSFGYETRKDTKQFDPTTPNGKLMIAVCTELLSNVR